MGAARSFFEDFVFRFLVCGASSVAFLFLRFLASAWDQWVALDAANADKDILPSVWPTRTFRTDIEPDNFAAKMGLYSYDAGTPFTDVLPLLRDEVAIGLVYSMIGMGLLFFFEHQSRRHATLELA